ncbi:hypothetical protein MWH25_04885 [Natroniella acetigena]|uniref:hypothetical protein n=1 Tax=Natroniella acetigena TaxID=52004 RepID=UPI00200A12C8|nr:hypothetical protein [Natroniella acetigena]MCK8827082.1 hypothetical protein [Natroniella acetigena]
MIDLDLNKILLIIAFSVVVILVTLYFWGSFFMNDEISSRARKVDGTQLNLEVRSEINDW